MTNAAGFAAINLNPVARARRAAFRRPRGARRAGRRGREGWSCSQVDAAVRDGSRGGKPALPRAPHLANASGKAQNLLRGNPGLTSGRVLISLFNLYPCSQLDPLPECLPTFTRQELPTSGWAPAGTHGRGDCPHIVCAQISTEAKGLPTPRGCKARRCMCTQQFIN